MLSVVRKLVSLPLDLLVGRPEDLDGYVSRTQPAEYPPDYDYDETVRTYRRLHGKLTNTTKE